MAVFYYSLFSWRMKKAEGADSFSMHLRSGWTAMSWGFVMAVVAESSALHLWIGGRAPLLSLALLFLDGYSILWLIADARALQLRPTIVEGDVLLLRYGARWEATIDFASIESVRRHEGEVRRDRGIVKLAMIEAPNFVLQLHEPARFDGMYGLRRNASLVYLLIDDDSRFEARMREAGLWRDPIVAPAAISAPREEAPAKMSREEWLRRKPDYVSEDDWMKFVPR
jgi:hypothetical protein